MGFDKFDEPLREFMKNYNAEKEDQARRTKQKKRSAPGEAQLLVNEDNIQSASGKSSATKKIKLNYE